MSHVLSNKENLLICRVHIYTLNKLSLLKKKEINKNLFSITLFLKVYFEELRTLSSS